jgi:GNAT superfamily N-acetyltransferase
MLRQMNLTECPASLIVQAFNEGYAGYMVPVAMDVVGFERRFRAENLDPMASALWLHGERPAAILLVARRGRISRVAGLGVAPDWRGRGLGRAAMVWAIQAARDRHDRWLELEVIASNTAAKALYAQQGFRALGALHGYDLDDGYGFVPTALRRVDPFQAAQMAGRFAEGDLPWPQHPVGMAARTDPTYGLVGQGEDIVALLEPSPGALRLTALALSTQITPEQAQAFTAALRVHAAGRPVRAPALFAPDHGARFFAAGGWQKTALEQIWMRHDLA